MVGIGRTHKFQQKPYGWYRENTQISTKTVTFPQVSVAFPQVSVAFPQVSVDFPQVSADFSQVSLNSP